MLERAENKVNGLLSELFPSEIRLGRFTIGLADEPIADRFGGYKKTTKDNGPEYRGTRPAYNGADGRRAFRDYVRGTGLNPRKVSHGYLMRRFNEDAIGYRIGNEIFYTGDRFERPLTQAEQDATIAHEIESGYDHENPDQEAHRNAIALLKRFNYKEAVEAAVRMQQNCGWN